MPHVVLEGRVDLEAVGAGLEREPARWGAAVIKTEGCWLRSDGLAVLVEGVVVEHARPLHPVAIVAAQHGDTSIRLWRHAPVERTPAVQRWLAWIAAQVSLLGTSSFKSTNISDDLLQGLELAPGGD